MATAKFDIKDLERRMRASMDQMKKEFSGLRTGRASVNLLDPVVVNVYGSKMPLVQVASISTPDAKTISVQVWDQGNVKAVEKAIADANLGLNPATAGNVIRLPMPPLTSDRRAELAKAAHKYAEHGRVSIRNVRREGMELLKKSEKDGMSEDESRKTQTKVQELTDKLIREIDAAVAAKEIDIKQV